MFLSSGSKSNKDEVHGCNDQISSRRSRSSHEESHSENDCECITACEEPGCIDDGSDYSNEGTVCFDDSSDFDYNSDAENESFEIAQPKHTRTLAEDLLVFMVIFNLPIRAQEYLLRMLFKHGVDVPQSVYHLKKDIVKPDILKTTVTRGHLAYLSIKENLKFAFDNVFDYLTPKNGTEIYLRLKVNIDGLSLFKSSRLNLWPITVQINDIKTPFPIALFCGRGKPVLSEYVQKLCEEIEELKSNVFSYSPIKTFVSFCNKYFLSVMPRHALLFRASKAIVGIMGVVTVE